MVMGHDDIIVGPNTTKAEGDAPGQGGSIWSRERQV